MRRQIEVTADVFHLIWSNWREGDTDENSILKRVLSQPNSATGNKLARIKEDSIYNKEKDTNRNAVVDIGKIRWVDDVRQAFRALGGEADLAAVYPLVERLRRDAGRSTVRSLEATVRQTIEAHSSDSMNFKPGNGDYFRHVGRGRWALR